MKLAAVEFFMNSPRHDELSVQRRKSDKDQLKIVSIKSACETKQSVQEADDESGYCSSAFL